MIARKLQRALDPSVGRERNSAIVIGGLAGALTVLAALISGAGVAAIPWGVVAFVPSALAIHFLLRGQRYARQEARDLWALSATVGTGRVWPAPGGWALGAGALLVLLDEIRQRNYRNVVELGPGVSSLVLGKVEPGLELYGLEHDERFVESLANWLEHHELDRYKLIHAPLRTEENGSQWYDREALNQLPESIDVLIVDGPPNWQAKGNRAPAWEILCDRVAPGGLILVDDANRLDERKMAFRWLEDPRLELLRDGEEFIALRVKSAGPLADA